MKLPLKGIFVPHMVPLDAGGRIDEPELRRYIDWLIASGVHGLYPNGSSGEFVRFTAEERRRIVRIVCEQAAGRVPVLAGAAEANPRQTLAACETYAEYGAAAVAIVSPFYYRLGPDAVYAYFREIADHSPIGVTLYNIPMFASPIDAHTIGRLAELPRIIGIKDSSGDMAHMLRMIAAIRPNRPDFTFLCGWDAALVPMLAMGCDGGTNAMAGVAPELLIDMYDLTVAGQLDRARDLQLRFIELFDAVILGADFPEGLRAAVELRGFRMGPSRQPPADRHPIDRAAVQGILHQLLTDFGHADAARATADPPAAAHAPAAAGPAPELTAADHERARRIARSVVDQLRRRRATGPTHR